MASSSSLTCAYSQECTYEVHTCTSLPITWRYPRLVSLNFATSSNSPLDLLYSVTMNSSLTLHPCLLSILDTVWLPQQPYQMMKHPSNVFSTLLWGLGEDVCSFIIADLKLEYGNWPVHLGPAAMRPNASQMPYLPVRLKENPNGGWTLKRQGRVFLRVDLTGQS